MKRIRVTVVYALPAGATEIEVEVPPGASVAEALARSGIALGRRSIAPSTTTVGIYGIRVAMDTVLTDGDRVEVYRPLRADPRDARRRRASRHR
ncbi:MAG: RnfH family protein [Casimicrobiaceae bacterium]